MESIHHYQIVDNNILIAMIVTSGMDKTYDGPCLNARQVIRAASSESTKGQGLGKLLYEIAMSVDAAKPITGDRSGTSKSAQQVYDKLPATTKDLDNIMDPKTPPKVDDCMMVGDKTINKVYYITPEAKQNALAKAEKMNLLHDQVIANVQDKLGCSISVFENAIETGADILFSQQYSKRRPH